MQLIAILGVLVAVNLGIVYVGSESLKEDEQAAQGVVEVETMPESEQGADANQAPEEKAQEK